MEWSVPHFMYLIRIFAFALHQRVKFMWWGRIFQALLHVSYFYTPDIFRSMFAFQQIFENTPLQFVS